MNRATLEQCNQTELVTLAAAQGVRTHYGAERETLIRCILGEQVQLPPNPFDRQRDEIMFILKKYEEQLRSQTECHKNCYAHTDGHVARCAYKSRKVRAREDFDF